MNSNDTARERVVEALQEFNDCADDFYCLPPDIDSDEGIAVTAIAAHSAHLWGRADDPEVVEAVARALYAHDVEHLIDADGAVPNGNEYRRRARMAITALLTALLGPKPEEVE